MSEYKWIAQDKFGRIARYHDRPVIPSNKNYWYSVNRSLVLNGENNDNWQSSLINLETHDYKIEDGILMKVEKHGIFKGSDMQFKNHKEEWIDCPVGSEYRIKPKTIKFRNYYDSENGNVYVAYENTIPENPKWIGEWVEVNVDE